MIEKIRRLLRLQREIDLNGVSLIGANAGAVFTDCKPLFVVRFHDFADTLNRKRHAIPSGALDQLVDSRPPVFVQSQPDFAGVVPEYQAQELALSHNLIFTHRFSVIQISASLARGALPRQTVRKGLARREDLQLWTSLEFRQKGVPPKAP